MATTRLGIPFEFICTHALPVRTHQHEHCYRLVLVVEGSVNPQTGFLINMEPLREQIDAELAGLRKASLNGNPTLEAMGEGGRAASRLPTCELLAACFGEHYQPVIEALEGDARLAAAEVHLVNQQHSGDPSDEEEFGLAVYTL